MLEGRPSDLVAGPAGPPTALRGVPACEQADFPIVGARARRFARFEADLEAWLTTTSDGRFALWRATREHGR